MSLTGGAYLSGHTKNQAETIHTLEIGIDIGICIDKDVSLDPLFSSP